MKTNDWLESAELSLTEAGIGTARLDALVLLEDELGIDRGKILAEPANISSSNLKRLNKNLSARLKFVPLAYIRQKTEFYGRDFFIDERVLEPRPETETMIEMLLAAKLPKKAVIADVGTGSGAIAVTVKLELPHAQVYACDIDKNCLAVARQNAKKHAVKIYFSSGDLVEPLLNKKIDVVLANLPYVPDDWHINQAAMHEPRQAIFGGQDGLELYRRLFKQLSLMSKKPALVFTEAMPPQHQALSKIAGSQKYNLDLSRDFVQKFITA